MATPENKLLPAAQYVRMSTEHQQYSTQHQKDRIQEYAAAHGLEVIKTYADEGKSGLRLKGRTALQRLLMDVAAGDAGYRFILVYDVSRWGRFQDTDESAHYEFLCRRAGIQVEYCAELFTNDGSFISSVYKSLKRVMAGEYSRELSVKSFASKARLAGIGYTAGGVAPYGLRRMVVDEWGQRKEVLLKGERKSIVTDRAVFVPGPAEEVEAVRMVFRWYTDERLTHDEIARRLTHSGVPPPVGTVWFPRMVKAILRKDAYAGDIVFNRLSNRLRKGVVHTPQAQWIVHRDAHPPIVDRATFTRAQVRLRQGRRFTDEELLEGLRTLYRREGKLSHSLVDSARWLPTVQVFTKRFGSLKNAAALVGYRLFDKKPLDAMRAHASRRMLSAYATAKRRELCAIGARADKLAYNAVVILGGYRVSFQRLPYGYRTYRQKNVECNVLLPEDPAMRESCCYVIPCDADCWRMLRCQSAEHLQHLARFEVHEGDLADELKALALQHRQRKAKAQQSVLGVGASDSHDTMEAATPVRDAVASHATV